MKITAVIVTYSNRANLVSDVAGECIAQGVDKIVIIDNGSPMENSFKLQSVRDSLGADRVVIYRNDKNEGSASGFSEGMCKASEASNPGDWVLVLDDDNKLDCGAIDILKNTALRKGEGNAFLCLRADRDHYNRYIETRENSVLLGRKNSFMLFSISSYILNKFNKSSNKKPRESSFDGQIVRCPCGPYGGLFISYNDMQKATPPNKDLFLYFDDTEYTYNFKDKGIDLWIIPAAKILDIDSSWGNDKLKKRFSDQAFESDEFRMVYLYRNRVYFERKYLVESIFKYLCNMAAYMTILGIKALLSGSIPRYKVICKSVCDGWRLDKEISKKGNGEDD